MSTGAFPMAYSQKSCRERSLRGTDHSVFPADLLFGHQREADQLLPFQVAAMHINSGDLAVFVGGIIIDTLVRIAAGSVNGDFQTMVNFTGTAGLVDRIENVEELADAAIYYRNKANFLAKNVKRDGAGDVVFDDFDTLALKAENGFDNLVYKHSYPIFAGSTLPVKKLGWANMYTSMGITGVTMGVTGEAAVNPQIPAVSLPFTMCHEMAHRMSITTERDANFAGFLACMANEDVQYQYSGYFMAYRYCYNSLLSANTFEASAAAARVASEVNAQLKHDMEAYNQLFASRRSETATKVADTANDTYLKASGDSAGVASYGEVTDLLVSWHYQKEILPTITQQEKKFDPYDENQVDLSGIVHAKDPQPTQPDVGGVG